MTTITLEIPDKLAERLAPLHDRLPDLLAQALELSSNEKTNGSTELAKININSPIYTEVLDFLASGPTSEQIASFKISPSLQERVEELLDKNREEGLDENESTELNTYLKLNHLMILLKARAHKTMPTANK
jgi:hypothetical protein